MFLFLTLGISLLKPWNIETIDIGQIKAILENERIEASELQHRIDVLRSLVDAFPELKKFTLSQLQKASVLIGEVERGVLAVRNKANADEGAQEIIKRACKYGESAHKLGLELETKLSLQIL